MHIQANASLGVFSFLHKSGHINDLHAAFSVGMDFEDPSKPLRCLILFQSCVLFHSVVGYVVIYLSRNGLMSLEVVLPIGL